MSKCKAVLDGDKIHEIRVRTKPVETTAPASQADAREAEPTTAGITEKQSE